MSSSQLLTCLHPMPEQLWVLVSITAATTTKWAGKQ